MKNTTIIAGLAILFTSTVAAQQFSHDLHVMDNAMACGDCHPAMIGGGRAAMPVLSSCLDCHDEEIGSSLGEHPSSHFGDYRHEHQFDARSSLGECALCHGESEDCSFCHRGENVDILAHDRNHRFLHSLDARKGTEDCYTCHASQEYCNGCHLSEGVKPVSHFEDGFRNDHSPAAQEDLASCIMCHDGLEPPETCQGCHD